MPCSCMPDCTCGSASACAASTCAGNGFAAAHFATMGSVVSSYRAMWYPEAGRARAPTPEVHEEIRAEIRERDIELLETLRGKLRRIESEAPGGLPRTEHHLNREKEKLHERIRRLEHEISILEG